MGNGEQRSKKVKVKRKNFFTFCPSGSPLASSRENRPTQWLTFYLLPFLR